MTRAEQIKLAVLSEDAAYEQASDAEGKARFALLTEMERIKGGEIHSDIDDVIARPRWQERLEDDSDDNKLPGLYEAYRKAKAEATRAKRIYENALDVAYEEVGR